MDREFRKETEVKVDIKRPKRTDKRIKRDTHTETKTKRHRTTHS